MQFERVAARRAIRIKNVLKEGLIFSISRKVNLSNYFLNSIRSSLLLLKQRLIQPLFNSDVAIEEYSEPYLIRSSNVAKSSISMSFLNFLLNRSNRYKSGASTS